MVGTTLKINVIVLNLFLLLWEHPHDSTSLSLFSSPPFLTALHSLVSNLHTKSVCNYFSIFPHSSSPSLSNSRLCSALPSQAPLPITAKRSLTPSLSVSTLAKQPFSGPHQADLIHQATPTRPAN